MEGFGTYRDRTEVHFDGVDLFALTGPTGAGKSTVVDAICMALYGSVPRYDHQGFLAPAISTGLPEALVHLDFTVDGSTYTALRVIRRTKGGANAKEARLESNGTILAGTPKELTQRVSDLLGMSFEHFTRCVVLPQGEFAKFLKDEPRKRQELLKQLLDITVYERVAAAARERAKDAKNRALLAAERLGDLAAATPERRAEISVRVVQLDKLYQDTQTQERELAALAGEATRAREGSETATAIAEKLQAVSIPVEVPALADQIAVNREQLHTAESTASQAAETLAAREQQLVELGDVGQLKIARQAHEQLEELAGATLERRAELVARAVTLEALHEELRTDEERVADLTSRLDAARQEGLGAERAAEALAGIAVPTAVVDVANRRSLLIEQLEATDKAIEDTNNTIANDELSLSSLGDPSELKAARNELERRASLVERQRALTEERTEADIALDEARAALASAREAHDLALVAVAEATVANEAHALRTHLVAGEPCPVCEQPVVSLPTSEMPRELAEAKDSEAAAAQVLKEREGTAAAAEKVVERVDLQLESVNGQVADIDRVMPEDIDIPTLDTRLGEISTAADALTERKRQQAELVKDAARLRDQERELAETESESRRDLLQTHAQVATLGAPVPAGADVLADWQALVSWAHTNAPEQVKRSESLAGTAATLTAELAAGSEGIRSKCADAGIPLRDGQRASEVTFREASSTQAAVTSLDEQLTTVKRLRRSLADFAAEHPTGDSSLKAIDAQLEATTRATAEVAHAKAARDEAVQQVQALRKRQGELATTEQGARREFLATHAQLAAFSAPVPAGRDVHADWLVLHAWAGEEGPEQLGKAATLAAEAAKLIEEVQGRQSTLRASCSGAGVEVNDGQSVSEALFAGLQTARAAVDQIDEQLAKAEELRTSIGRHHDEEVVANELARLLKADQFEKWLLDDVLTQLVDGATTMLKELSGEQFSLLYDDGDFLVVDHWNADQTRQAETLSGGETFLASLSLALSLADQLASFAGASAGKLDALFLDEGFGTLDADTLDVVASAIEELGSRGRMVGLISHVPELAERVPVRFEVQKVANASRITRVLQ
jgi:exonuclease SbcC